MADNAADNEVFVYTCPGGDVVPQDVVHVRVDPSVMSIPARAFCRRKKFTEVELCEGVVKLGKVPSRGAAIRLQRSPSPTHSGGLMMEPYTVLFDALFISTMALKVLEHTHLVAASSPILESHPSSP
jgi:hypothetical protein